MAWRAASATKLDLRSVTVPMACLASLALPSCALKVNGSSGKALGERPLALPFKLVREAGVVVEVSCLSCEWAAKVKAEVRAWHMSALLAA